MSEFMWIFLLMCIVLFGFSGTFRNLPGILFFGLILFGLGWFFTKFFWLILLIWLLRYLMNLGKPKPQRRTQYQYRTYTQQDFEEFMRQAMGGGTFGQGQRRGGSSQGGYRSPFPNMEDYSKYYALLGVSESASKEEVKRAYLAKVKEHHPDRFSGASEEEKKYHEEMLKKINEAYDKIEKRYAV